MFQRRLISSISPLLHIINRRICDISENLRCLDSGPGGPLFVGNHDTVVILGRSAPFELFCVVFQDFLGAVDAMHKSMQIPLRLPETPPEHFVLIDLQFLIQLLNLLQIIWLQPNEIGMRLDPFADKGFGQHFAMGVVQLDQLRLGVRGLIYL
jgi:hypothetical protein